MSLYALLENEKEIGRFGSIEEASKWIEKIRKENADKTDNVEYKITKLCN